MFRIRRVYDDLLPANRETLRQVKQILTTQIHGLDLREIDSLGERLRDPFKQQFRSIFFVAERHPRTVTGFAIAMLEPAIGFVYLDFIAADPLLKSRGVGAALYQVVREEAMSVGAKGIFFECLPDDPATGADPAVLKQNRARLRFYEAFGALPIVNTAYEMPVDPGDESGPHLVFDGLGRAKSLGRSFARKVVRAVLERKYTDLCPPHYVQTVVESFRDHPVRLRAPRYVKSASAAREVGPVARGDLIPLLVNDNHMIHHVHDRGYVEAPVRIKRIMSELSRTSLFEDVKPREHSLKPIRAVHDRDFVEYLRRMCSLVPEGKSVYPYVFPIRNTARPPKELPVRAGYYCIDTFTPLNRNAYLAAKGAVDCALTAAETILEGRRIAYALVRPPGHHAERRVFGGFCYFNNSAIAAHFLSAFGKVAIVDLDYHHGNGQQSIFYERPDVLTLSIHGHPRFAYPYFTGFDTERGAGRGLGFNRNYALREDVDGPRYLKILERALKKVERFAPAFLVVALGLDTAKGDPTGTWKLNARDFETNGFRVGATGLPILVVQEGGYLTRTLGVNARNFFKGLTRGARRI